MDRWFLNLNVMSGPIPAAVWVITAIVGIVLLVRDHTRNWIITALPAVLGGAGLGVGIVWWCNASDAFGVPLPHGTGWWMSLAGGGIGLGIASLWRTHWWRKAVAGLLIVLAPLSAGLGINAGFGLTPTIADVLGINTLPSVGALPALPAHHDAHPGRPIDLTWRPPAGMPDKGRIGTLSGAERIPSTGGFAPRDATIYLPPAALVPDAPALPLVVMMNGKPGRPNPSYVRTALDTLAARHHGLAPIVIIADQLGSPSRQPACSPYSVFGNVSRYFNTDIVRYARSHLNVLTSPKDWTIAGYSDGGACALKWAAQYPKIWGNMISLSGDLFPGASEPRTSLAQGFRGSQVRDLAQRPSVFVAENRLQFAGHHAFFTAGALDPRFSGYAVQNAELLRRAGFTVSLQEIAGATHVGTALSGGLLAAFGQLYPVLGLAPSR